MGHSIQTQGVLEKIFKEANKILNPLDANFKSSDSKITRVSESALSLGGGGGGGRGKCR